MESTYCLKQLLKGCLPVWEESGSEGVERKTLKRREHWPPIIGARYK